MGMKAKRLATIRTFLCIAAVGGFLIAGMLNNDSLAANAGTTSTSTAISASSPAPWPTSFPARQFNSKLQFGVYIIDQNGEDQFVGFTPSEEPLAIPPCSMWYVVPKFELTQKTEEFVAEANLQNISGLSLNEELIEENAIIISRLSNLKFLDICNIESPDVISLLTPLKGLESLRVGFAATEHNITDESISHLAKLQSLRAIEIDFPSISDDGMAYFRGLDKLQKLSLWGAKITDVGLSNLSGLGELQELNIGLADISDTGLKFLSGLKKMKKLNLSGTNITGAGLANLKPLENLQELDLACADKLQADNLAILKEFKGLRKLNFMQSHGITNAGLKHLIGLKNLQEVNLSYCHANVTDAGMDFLDGCNSLQKLNLTCTAVTPNILEKIGNLTDLRELGLASSNTIDGGMPSPTVLIKVTDSEMAHLSSLKKLRVLDISDSEVGDVGLGYLKDCNDLQELNLCATKITDLGMECLKNFPKLQCLYIASTNITNIGLANLEGLTELRELSLSGTQITSEGLGHLKNLSRLQELTLCGVQINDVGVENLKKLKKLRYLWLDSVTINDANLAELKKALPNCYIN